MNMNDAKQILYPILPEREKDPEFDEGKFYLINGEIMEFTGKVKTTYRFHGNGMLGREYNSKWKWARTHLSRAVPALGWEVKDMLEKRESLMKAASSYYKKFGTATE